MKKISIGLMTIVLALSAVAFTNAKSPKTNHYWFQLDPVTGAVISATSLPQLGPDPSNCSIGTHYCAAAYDAFIDNHDGTYSPSGARVKTDMKP
jgi:hypothetical protein